MSKELLNEVYEGAFYDELQKIAEGKEKGPYGYLGSSIISTYPRALLGAIGGGAGGAGVGAGLGALAALAAKKSPKAGAALGAGGGYLLGGLGGLIHGKALGSKSMLNKYMKDKKS